MRSNMGLRVSKWQTRYEHTRSVVDQERKPSTPKILLLEHLHFLDEVLVEDDKLGCSKGKASYCSRCTV